jgi:LacI family transcriptional regulator, repressor for deo operon, udp, cdd, tsx, nupC, and nupG
MTGQKPGGRLSQRLESMTVIHPRLVDVAAQAGVSMRTVSNVVNGFPHVSPQTRERVEKAVAQLGYRPNLTARNLARGRTGLVALVVPRLEMPYFAALAQQVLEVSESEGLYTVIQQTHNSHELELEALEGRFGQRIDGVVLSPTTLDASDVVARKSDIPLVLLGDKDWRTTRAWTVGIDHEAASEAAVAHLLATGHRRIGMVGPGLSVPGHRRWVGYVRAHEKAGVETDPHLIFETAGLSGQDGAIAGERLAAMDDRPDALFCLTDWVALGVIRGLQRAGVSVPDDVAVVGYDDIPYGRAANPTLTTIAPDRREIATISVQSLLDQAAGMTEEPHAFVTGWQLVVRESSGGDAG